MKTNGFLYGCMLMNDVNEPKDQGNCSIRFSLE